MLTPENAQELLKALLAARKTFGAVKKSAQGQARGGRYRYATLADALEATADALADAGLLVTQSIVPQEKEEPHLVTTLWHTSGGYLSSTYPLATSPMDPQRFGSALTYARRYSYMALLGLAPTDEDDGARATEEHRTTGPQGRGAESKASPASKAQGGEIVRLMAELGVDRPAIGHALAKVLDRPAPVLSSSLTKADASAIIEALKTEVAEVSNGGGTLGLGGAQ